MPCHKGLKYKGNIQVMVVLFKENHPRDFVDSWCMLTPFSTTKGRVHVMLWNAWCLYLGEHAL